LFLLTHPPTAAISTLSLHDALPISAFSPGPWITQGALVGRPRKCRRDDLYEQCSFHIAEKIPSSVKLGTRPINLRMRSYSSGFRDRKSTRLNSSHLVISYAVFCLKK